MNFTSPHPMITRRTRQLSSFSLGIFARSSTYSLAVKHRKC